MTVRGRMSVLFAILLFGGLVLALPFAMGDPRPSEWTRDTLQVVWHHALDKQTCCKATYGLISQLGIMLWSGAAAAAFLVSLTLFLDGDRQRGGPFLVLALGTAVMAIDDALMVHERTELDLVLLGIYALTIATACIGVVYPRIDLAFGEFLALGIVFLSGALLIDCVMPQTDMVIFVEDALKFMGICLWFAYLILRGAAVLSAPTAAPAESGSGLDRATPGRPVARFLDSADAPHQPSK